MIVPPSEEGHALYNSFEGPRILVAVDHWAFGCVLEQQSRRSRNLKVKQRKDARAKILDEGDDGRVSANSQSQHFFLISQCTRFSLPYLVCMSNNARKKRARWYLLKDNISDLWFVLVERCPYPKDFADVVATFDGQCWMHIPIKCQCQFQCQWLWY